MAAEPADERAPLFRFRDVHFAYRPGEALLRGLSLDLPPGEFAGLIGPNGVGKTTLVRLMTGLCTPTRGDVLFRGRSVRQWDRRAFAREVAVVPQQEDALFPYSVRETILMGRYAHQHALVGFDDDEDQAIAEGVLKLVDLEGFGSRRMDALSGGERQRVLVARALAQCPTVLLLDEPTSSMDLRHQRDLFSLLEELNTRHGITVFAVTHDINLASMYCRRVVVLDEDGIAADGAPDQVVTEETLRRVYRVSVDVLQGASGTPVVSVRK